MGSSESWAGHGRDKYRGGVIRWIPTTEITTSPDMCGLWWRSALQTAMGRPATVMKRDRPLNLILSAVPPISAQRHSIISGLSCGYWSLEDGIRGMAHRGSRGLPARIRISPLFSELRLGNRSAWTLTSHRFAAKTDRHLGGISPEMAACF